MSRHTLRFSSAALLLALTAACSGDTLAPAADSSTATELELAFESLAAQANSEGDVERSESMSGGATALRMGVRPSIIEVTIDGELVRYNAVVAGINRRGDDGVVRPMRRLIAWTGDRTPEQVLEVSLASDQGDFGIPGGNPSPTARGTWTDRTAGERWVAVNGGAEITLASSGEPCGRPLAENLSTACAKARWNVRVAGGFALRRADQSLGEATLSISTLAEGVSGILITPNNP